MRTGALISADDDHCADLFDLNRSIMTKAGLPAYEISNHAKPGQESRHNQTYWRYQDYVGIGPGAHGRRLESATERHKKPENFLSAVERNGNGLKVEQALSPETRAMEALMMGLRLAEGLDLRALEAKTGLAAAHMLDQQAVDHLSELGPAQCSRRTADHFAQRHAAAGRALAKDHRRHLKPFAVFYRLRGVEFYRLSCHNPRKSGEREREKPWAYSASSSVR